MRLRFAATSLLLGLVLAGCTTNIYGEPLDGRAPSSVAPTAPECYEAVAEPGEYEVDEQCVGDQVEERMAGNDMYRQRMELAPDDAAAAEVLLPAATAELESLRVAGTVTLDQVVVALESAGLTEVQTLGGDGAVSFGAQPPVGGCVFGSVTSEAVTIEAGGYIMDGGCLPAQ